MTWGRVLFIQEISSKLHPGLVKLEVLKLWYPTQKGDNSDSHQALFYFIHFSNFIISLSLSFTEFLYSSFLLLRQ